jgi:hypothetical protein
MAVAGRISEITGQETGQPRICPSKTGFSLADLQSACPGVSVDLIRSVLKRLKGKSVECMGRGHTAKWRKTAK